MSSRPVLRGVVLLAGWGLVGGTLLLGYMAVRISAQGDRDERRPADAIVVMGAAQFNGRPGDVFEARLRHAVDLYDVGLASYLIVTGGKLPGDRTTEADSAREWAIEHGVPAEAILGENKGRNTLASIEAVARIMRDNGLTSAVFVSDQTHMLRVLRMASDEGIVAWGSPTRTSPSDGDEARRRKAMVHELAGLVAYYLGAGRLVEETSSLAAP